ncbi:YicC/YloC family endoribonuclease [Aliiroseovarius sp.]|uniref:YicC/YloC family endoribonuclease n=1 Tax=Aliiroseovarius sp. TaxID=1872442 RepID=UPI003BACF166
MVYSMTGFAALKGAYGDFAWSWDIRAVNAKGLDIRLRAPDWIEGLEPAIRKAVGGAAARGNVSVSLRVARAAEEGALALNGAALDRTLSLLAEISHAAEAKGLALAPMTAADLAGMRGVLDVAAAEEDTAPLLKALTAQLPELLSSFNDMRAREGAALAEVLAGQVDRIEALTAEAAALVDARSEAQAETLRTALARVMENTDGADADRVAQELALIAVKTDVREELDRLVAHVAAARELLGGDAPRGRKLDFLMQEFNREANTLCSKAQFAELTRIGLDLKAVIDQMREQVQNVE